MNIELFFCETYVTCTAFMIYVMLISGDSFFFSFVSFVQELHRLDMIIFLHIQVWYRASFIHLISKFHTTDLGLPGSIRPTWMTKLEIQGLRLRRGTSCATLGPGGSLAGCLGEAPAWWISGTHSTRHGSYRSWDAGMDAAGGAAQCRRITEKKRWWFGRWALRTGKLSVEWLPVDFMVFEWPRLDISQKEFWSLQGEAGSSASRFLKST